MSGGNEEPVSALGLLSSMDGGDSGLSALDALKSNDDLTEASGLSLLGSLGESNGTSSLLGGDSNSALDLLNSGGSALDALGALGNGSGGGSALDLLGSGTSALDSIGGSSLLGEVGTSTAEEPSALSGLLGGYGTLSASSSTSALGLLGTSEPESNGSALGLLTSGGAPPGTFDNAPVSEPMDVDFGPPPGPPPGEVEDDGFIDIRASTDLTLNPEMAATMSSQPRDDRPGRGRGGGRGGLFRSDVQRQVDGRRSPKREDDRRGDKENRFEHDGKLLSRDTTGYLDQSEKIDTSKDPNIVSSLVEFIPRNTRMSLASRLRKKGFRFYSIKQMRSRLFRLRRKDFKIVRFNMKFRAILSNPPVVEMGRLSPTVTSKYEWPPLPPTWKQRRKMQIEQDKIEEAKFQLAYAKLQRQAGMGGNSAKEEKLRMLIEAKKMKEQYQRTGYKPDEDRKPRIRDKPVYKSSFQSALGSFKIGKKRPSDRDRSPSPAKDTDYSTYGLTGLAMGAATSNPSRGGFAGRGRVFRSSSTRDAAKGGDYVSPLMRNQPQKQSDPYATSYSRAIIKDGGKLSDIMKGKALGMLPVFEGGEGMGETAQTNVAIVGMVTDDNKVVGCAEPEKPGAIPTSSTGSSVNPFAPPPMNSGGANPFAPKPLQKQQQRGSASGTPTYQDPRGTPTYSDPSRTPVYNDPPMTPSYQDPPATPAYQDSPRTPVYQEPGKKSSYSSSSRHPPKAAPVVNPNAFVEGLSDEEEDSPPKKKPEPPKTFSIPKRNPLSAAADLIKKSKVAPPKDDRAKSAKAFMDKVGLKYKAKQQEQGSKSSSPPNNSSSRSTGGSKTAPSAFVEGLSDDDDDDVPPKPTAKPMSKPSGSSSVSKPPNPSKDPPKSSSNLMATLNKLKSTGKSDPAKYKPAASESKPSSASAAASKPSGGTSALQEKLAMLKKGGSSKPASETKPPEKKKKTPAQLRQLMSFLLKNPKSVLNTNPAMQRKAQQLLPILIEMEKMAEKNPNAVEAHVLKPIEEFLNEATGKK